MLRIDLIVDFVNQLPLIDLLDGAPIECSAGIGRCRKHGCHLERGLVERRRIDSIINERSLQCDLLAAIASRRGGCSEITRQHLRCWNETGDSRRVGSRYRALIAAEEEQFVLHEGTADRAAVLIALQ